VNVRAIRSITSTSTTLIIASCNLVSFHLRHNFNSQQQQDKISNPGQNHRGEAHLIIFF
jgi:hypothetical protein